jgi:hypothetical protein
MKLRAAGLFAIGLIAVTAMPAFASGTFQRTGSMNVARIGHTATLLANGEVLSWREAITEVAPSSITPQPADGRLRVA